MKKRKELIGRVFSNKMEKTAVVVVDRMTKDSVYHKYIKRRSKFKAHDEKNVCRIGDRVKIIETRPMSADKRWLVLEVVERVGV